MDAQAALAKPRRVSWWRVPVWALAILAALVAVASGGAWVMFRQLSDELRPATRHLAGAVRGALAADSTSTSPVTVLLLSPGGSSSAVLLRLDPHAHQSTAIALSGTTTVAGLRVAGLTTTGKVSALITALSRAGFPVNHVVLLDPARVGTIVDKLGGVTLAHTDGATLLDPSGRSFSVHSGKVSLSGRLTEAYLYGDVVSGPASSAASRQVAVFEAIGQAIFTPTSLAPTAAEHLARAMTAGSTTDLTATSYLRALAAWGHVDQARTCVPSSGSPGSPRLRCQAQEVTPPLLPRYLTLLGDQPSTMLALILSLAALVLGGALLALEVTSSGFRQLRLDISRRRAHRHGTADTGAGDPAPRRPLWPSRRPFLTQAAFSLRRPSVPTRRSVGSDAFLLAVAVGFGFLIANALSR